MKKSRDNHPIFALEVVNRRSLALLLILVGNALFPCYYACAFAAEQKSTVELVTPAKAEDETASDLSSSAGQPTAKEVKSTTQQYQA